MRRWILQGKPTHPAIIALKIVALDSTEKSVTLDLDDAQTQQILAAHGIRPFGLGDAVAAMAQPIAKAIDRIAGTNLKGCGGCQKRRDSLNKLTLQAITKGSVE